MQAQDVLLEGVHLFPTTWASKWILSNLAGSDVGQKVGQSHGACCDVFGTTQEQTVTQSQRIGTQPPMLPFPFTMTSHSASSRTSTDPPGS